MTNATAGMIGLGWLALGVLVSTSAGAQNVGRLFISVEDRAQLDEVRREYEYGEELPEEKRAEVAVVEEEDPLVSSLTVNGLVVRSSGHNSTWINGDRISRGATTREGIAVRDDRRGNVRFTLPSGVETIELKAGQRIDIATGRVLEVYERRAAEEREARLAFDLENAEPAPSDAALPVVEVPPGSADEDEETVTERLRNILRQTLGREPSQEDLLSAPSGPAGGAQGQGG